ncbi:MAG TPA: cytochrome P450, partial [Allocoleopsis sp.]
NPQLLEELLTNDTKKFTAPGEINRYLFESLLGNNSVTTVSGDIHKRQRQLMMPSFHGDRMKSYGEIIADITQNVINNLPTGKPISMRAEMQSISLKVILKAVFGFAEGERYEKIAELIKHRLDDASSPLSVMLLYLPFLRVNLGFWNPWEESMKQQQEIDDLIYAEIQERKANFDLNRIDILNLLMAAKDESGESMTNEELRDELMTLLVAGHETTATALTWALYWIHKQPEIATKLRAEINNLGANPDFMAIFKLPYLNAVCNETLRIYPVGMLTFPRVLKTSGQLLDYEVAANQSLTGCIYLTHHREDLYPNSKTFNPDRFLNRQFSPYEFLPFGGGARRCLGMAFAQFEMKIVLAKIISGVELKLANNSPVKVIRRGLTASPSEVELVKTGVLTPPVKQLELV